MVFENKLRIVFFGTPAWVIPFLDVLRDALDMEIALVVCPSDKPQGRDGEVRPCPVKLAAQKYGLPLAQFASLKKPETIDTLKNARAHLFVVLAYGKILPNTALVLPSLGSINVHPSLLPLYRGPDPIRAPILRGDGQT